MVLGMRRIFIHRYSGILSAYGLSLADIVVCIRLHIRMFMYVYMYVYVCIYICTYIYIGGETGTI
jgi:hypothetical protein